MFSTHPPFHANTQDPDAVLQTNELNGKVRPERGFHDKLSGSSVLVGGFYETESLNGLRAVILRARGANIPPRAQ
jgi:hypothetical protein